jgi:Dolichyl-phosphate-mannose-protein mannosyltransferase
MAQSAAQRAAVALRGVAAWRYADALALGLLVAVITALNQLWLTLENRPPHWDEARHLKLALVYRDLWSGLDWLTQYHLYPPFVYWVADAFYAIFGTDDEWAAVLSQSVFLTVLAFSTYGLGRRLWSRRVGLLSAFFVVMSPMVISQFKDFMTDVPLVAMTACALYMLVRCEAFSARGASVAFGVACGFGLLTKWVFAFVFVLPVAYALVAAVRWTLTSRSWSRVVNLGGAAAATALIAGPWYASNFDDLRAEAERTRFSGTAAVIEGDPPVVSPASVLWYAWNLLSNQLYLLPFLLFVCGVVLLFRRPGAARRNVYPVLLIASCYVSFTLLENKDARYSEPMLVGVAVVATYWLDTLRPRLRRVAVGAVIAYGAVLFYATSFGVGLLPQDAYVHLGKGCRFYPYFRGPCPGSSIPALQSYEPSGEIANRRGIRIWSQNGFINGPPSGERWYQEEMFEEAARSSASRTIFFQAPPLDFIWFNDFTTDYFAYKHGVHWVPALAQADFAGVRTVAGEQPPELPGFRDVRRFELPAGGALTLYARELQVLQRGAPSTVAPDELARAAATLGHAVYWAGPRANHAYELTIGTNGNAFVRYLPPGVAAGDSQAYLTVASYPLRDAFAVTLAAASGPNAERVPVDGAVAFVNELRPTSVFLAYPGSDVQVEVSHPRPGEARALVSSGAIGTVR